MEVGHTATGTGEHASRSCCHGGLIGGLLVVVGHTATGMWEHGEVMLSWWCTGGSRSYCHRYRGHGSRSCCHGGLGGLLVAVGRTATGTWVCGSRACCHGGVIGGLLVVGGHTATGSRERGVVAGHAVMVVLVVYGWQ